ncbi:MAG: hypothetical protein QM233_01590 [Candidatus Cloacimonadota bacterium]|jgi:hypothetical protein|nr:hypothetical protein [Candidatus Cloacimonadota bacterium]OQC09526.1 MAG: hypothetical protein BWX75_00990 [Candidatus Cloacimonetes bacterium ADurb.Bin088]
MPDTDYRKLFDLYLFENRLVRKAIADDEASAILSSLAIPDNAGDQQKAKRKIEPGNICCYVGEDCCLEYLVLEQNDNTWLVLKISSWIDFADQYDLIFSHDNEPKMIQLRNAAFVLPDIIEQSLCLGNAGSDILKLIQTTLLEKDRVAEDHSGTVLPIKWRFFQQYFHSIEADLMQQHLHHDWKNQPLPVPLPLPATLAKQQILYTSPSSLAVMRSWTSALATLGKNSLNQLINPLSSCSVFASCIVPTPLFGNPLVKNITEKVKRTLAGLNPKAPKQVKESVNNLGISLLYSSPSTLLWSTMNEVFREDFSYRQEPSGEIILKINPMLVGKEAQIKIKDKMVFSGVLKPVFSLGNNISYSKYELAELTEINIQKS